MKRIDNDRRLGVIGKAMELSQRGKQFADTFGNREFRAFVGFIDLVGSSSATRSKSPSEIRSHIVPFVDATINSLEAANCFIDKTIGDEVMFVLPDMEAEYGLHIHLRIGQAMGAIQGISSRFGSAYPFRLGLSFGTVMVDRIGNGDFAEMTTFGQPAILAKRLHGLPELINPNLFAGAISILTSEAGCESTFPIKVAYVTLSGMRWNILRSSFVEEFKGIGQAKVCTFGG